MTATISVYIQSCLHSYLHILPSLNYKPYQDLETKIPKILKTHANDQLTLFQLYFDLYPTINTPFPLYSCLKFYCFIYLKAMKGCIHTYFHISCFFHFKLYLYQIINMSNQTPKKILTFLFYSNKRDKSSFLFLHEIYRFFLTRPIRMKMHSLDQFGKNFQYIIPIQATQENLKAIDYIILVGDNQTFMEVAQYYKWINTPPILGFGYGCGPGLYNFISRQAEKVLPLAFQRIIKNDLSIQKLMKIECKISCQKAGQSFCQIQIQRGVSQPILILNIFLENQKRQKIKIAQFRGDGLLLSTPTGSYCKSLNLNGPLMCKTMQNIMITPICPLSMKFRPICLPAESKIFMQIDGACRTNFAQIYFDESKTIAKFNKGQLLRIRRSRHSVNMISNILQSNEQQLIRTLKSAMRWGQSYHSVEYDQIKKKDSLLQSIQF